MKRERYTIRRYSAAIIAAHTARAEFRCCVLDPSDKAAELYFKLAPHWSCLRLEQIVPQSAVDGDLVISPPTGALSAYLHPISRYLGELASERAISVSELTQQCCSSLSFEAAIRLCVVYAQRLADRTVVFPAARRTYKGQEYALVRTGKMRGKYSDTAKTAVFVQHLCFAPVSFLFTAGSFVAATAP